MKNDSKIQEKLQVINLSVAHGGKSILHDISFDANLGELVGLIGTNGCGKTTLLNCLTKFNNSFKGKIFWHGQDLDGMETHEISALVTMCGDIPSPFYNCNVGEMILFGRSRHAGFFGTYSREDERIALEAAQLFELERYLNSSFLNLSQGEKQRVNLAMSICSKTSWYLLDEPLSHLDPYFQKKLFVYLKNLVKEKKCGVLSVVHNLNLASHFDKIILIKNGLVANQGTPEEVLTTEILNSTFGENVFSVTTDKQGKNFNFLNI